MQEQAIAIKTQNDILIARQAGRELAGKLGFRLADQTRLATAISELTRNVIKYAGEGICRIRNASGSREIKIEVEVEDWGGGIPDLDQAMTDGFSSGMGLGAGLPGTRRLMQEFQIESVPGHTLVRIALLRKRLGV